MPGLMVSEFVVVWFELNWLRADFSEWEVWVAGREVGLECEDEWTSGRGWGISAALDAWSERLSFLVV